MKRIFLDTNFIIDYFIRDDFSQDSEKLLRYGSEHKLKFYISYLTVANFAYIMRKMPSNQLKDIIQRMCITFIVVSNTKQQILQNLQDPFPDFEDGLQFQAAMEAKCDCIISRNVKDFTKSEIAVMTAAEFLSSAR